VTQVAMWICTQPRVHARRPLLETGLCSWTVGDRARADVKTGNNEKALSPVSLLRIGSCYKVASPEPGCR
jgi:hypothetical protein